MMKTFFTCSEEITPVLESKMFESDKHEIHLIFET